MEMAVFWGVMIEAVSSSETSISIYQTSRCNIPECSYLHTLRREDLKSHWMDLARSRDQKRNRIVGPSGSVTRELIG
jgi:hypothetical protein